MLQEIHTKLVTCSALINNQPLFPAPGNAVICSYSRETALLSETFALNQSQTAKVDKKWNKTSSVWTFKRTEFTESNIPSQSLSLYNANPLHLPHNTWFSILSSLADDWPPAESQAPPSVLNEFLHTIHPLMLPTTMTNVPRSLCILVSILLRI